MLTRLSKVIKLPKNEGLNLIPFIDIMLVLLAVSLSISSFISQNKLDIKLAKTHSGTTINLKSFNISIDKNNNFYLDNQKVSLETLKAKLATLNKETQVNLKSDKDAKFENFITIIDLLKSLELANFNIITEKAL